MEGFYLNEKGHRVYGTIVGFYGQQKGYGVLCLEDGKFASVKLEDLFHTAVTNRKTKKSSY